MSILIRAATYSDIREIVKVQERSQKILEFKDFSEEVLGHCLLSNSDLYSIWAYRLAYSEEYLSYVAYDNVDEAIVGVVGFQSFEGLGYIRCLYVDPDYTGIKVGTKLLQSAISFLKKEYLVEKVRLEVLEDNVTAKGFYIHNGFTFTDFVFPEALGGTAQRLFPPKFNIKVLQMENTL